MMRLLSLALVSASLVTAQVDVLTANYSNDRTNANNDELVLNTSNVNPTQFGKVFTFSVDGQVYAQPLYVHGLNIPGKGTLNVLYVATMHNSVYAFDADAKTGTGPLWKVNFGAPVDPNSITDPQIGTYTDILNEIGILSTPVIDRAGGTLYVVNETTKGSGQTFYLHALDLTTGSEKLNGPVEIQATVTGTGWGGTADPHDGKLPLLPGQHIQRPGLLLANNAVYIGFGSHGDYTPWHGWILAYNAADIQQQTAVFCTTPSDAGSSIWQGGRGLAADPNGEIYASTGNGSYDGTKAWGETVLHLTPDLKVADWFTPAEYPGWNDDDADYGSNGPILVPNTNLLIAGGKAGLVTVVDRTNMGHELANDTQALQTFQAVPSGKYAIFNSAVWNHPDGPYLYIWGYNDPLRAFRMQNGQFNTSASSINNSIPLAEPLVGMSVSSNGFVSGSGILWATSISAGFPGPGTLHAFDATKVSRELWSSDMRGARDTMGNFSKFANPTVANGRVYMPTDSKQVVVYGLLNAPGIAAVVNAASFRPSTVAPGEVISIFGFEIGPSTPLGLALDSHGAVSTARGGVTATFDGAPAPLLYVSANQINAVVPFSVAGKATTSLNLTAPSGNSYSATLPVSDAAPSIFTMDSSGTGAGAILNSDLSVNSTSRPAARGSAIAIYATGTGVLTPAISDGAVLTDNTHLAAVEVTVTIGGQSAAVSYQGAAPGLVAGVMQINAQIPAGVTPGPAVPVTIAVGNSAGLNTVSVAVQ
ncbi:MAG: hypothetical protein U0Q18_06875 [Bryobacteraceae bacterium]